jgi:hypothetical protein
LALEFYEKLGTTPRFFSFIPLFVKIFIILDAKTKLPSEAVVQANLGTDHLCADISALLCNENDSKLVLNS